PPSRADSSQIRQRSPPARASRHRRCSSQHRRAEIEQASAIRTASVCECLTVVKECQTVEDSFWATAGDARHGSISAVYSGSRGGGVAEPAKTPGITRVLTPRRMYPGLTGRIRGKTILNTCHYCQTLTPNSTSERSRMTNSLPSSAAVPAAKPVAYMRQLCKHF